MKRKRGEDTDCDNCLPRVLPANQDAVDVYLYVRNQAIYIGMDSVPVDLDFKAVKIVMDMLGIKNQTDCFQCVLKMWHHIAELDRLKRKNKK